MLESFRLPGEAQQIGRVADTFAAKYFNSNPSEWRFQIKPIEIPYVFQQAGSRRKMVSMCWRMPLLC